MAPPSDLRDAHLHLAAHGEELSCVPLADCGSVEECLRRVAARASETPADGWVVARGARTEAWGEARYPTAAELDEAGGGRPVLVASFDHHAGAGSNSALGAAGITRGADDPPGGVIERDPATGAPTGLVLEGAFKRVCRAMPRATDGEVTEHIRVAQRGLMSLGFVEVHDMMTSGREAALLCAMEEAGEIELEIVCYATPDQFEAVRRTLGAHAERRPSARVRFGGLKLFIDGTLNSRTAHMLRAYADPIPDYPCGTPLMSRGEIDAAFARARGEGFDVAAHAIGDAAVRTLLDGYEDARASGAGGFGLRIEHAQFVDEEDVGRFGGLGVIASLQPCHLLADIEAIARLTPERAGRAFPLRELIDGARAAGRDPVELVRLGSDTPIVPPTPSDNVQAAVYRRRAAPDCPVIGPDQAISEDEAWSLMRARSSR